jgi:GT2 family glycosyltransferase
MKDILTVVIACKDRERNLTYCLDSISRSTVIPKVIVVDFGSKQSLLSKFSYDWLKIIRVNNVSLFHKARALNIGLKAAKTKFVCFTDTDQIFQSNFFETIIAVLSKNEKLCILCKSNFLKELPSNFSLDNYSQLLRLTKKNRIHGEGCCIGLKTGWLKKVNGWDESYVGYGGEDSDMIFRAKISGYKPTWINKFTSTIHLPHLRDKVYHSTKHLKNNRKRYGKRTLKKDIIVNVGKKWGML